MTYRNPSPSKPSFLQERSSIRTQQSLLGIRELPQHHLQNAEKKDEKNDTTTQMASGDITLCPLRAAAAIVRRIRSYPGANNDTPTSAFWRYDSIDHITSKQILNALKDAVSAIGEDSLHIAATKIGTNSIRSGAAMAMLLGKCPVFLIMMISR
jgi:hypothetical protein